jgi:hypothetical protein
MSDCISRQAAIDATWEEPTYTDPLNVLTEVRDRIKALPSAKPDLSSYSDKLWRNAYERGRAEAEAEQHWIPCSERLPEMTHFTQDVNPFSDDVLVTIRNEYGSKCLLIGFFDSQHGWLFSDQQPIDGFTWKPIAWQPLPDPYKKEGDRNE